MAGPGNRDRDRVAATRGHAGHERVGWKTHGHVAIIVSRGRPDVTEWPRPRSTDRLSWFAPNGSDDDQPSRSAIATSSSYSCIQ
jgi:hypothetical protein